MAGLRQLACAAVLCAALPALARAENNMLFILDASNSMWGQAGGEAKIDTAKRVLGDALGDLEGTVTPGLMVYGHRSRRECSDVELVAPFGAADAATIRGYIAGLNPRGKTPIAASLERAIEAFAGREEENNSILLISDGIETCGGDPCAAAAELIKRGINVRVNVVGFDVDAEARAQLQCIAEAGGGRYFEARDANDFTKAVAEVKQEAKAPPPPPPPAPKPAPAPAGSEYWFADEFDGNALSDAWTVRNPNPDNMLVENGAVHIVVHDGRPAVWANGSNILVLDRPLPKGDWRITIRFVMDAQTFGEHVRVGVAKDSKSSVLAGMRMDTPNYARTNAVLDIEKLSKGKATGFDRPLAWIESRTLAVRGQAWAEMVRAVQLRLTKKKRKYTASLRFEPQEGADLSDEWQEVQEVSSLKPPGDRFAIIFGSVSSDYLPHEGEAAVAIDWVRIEQPQ
ncbi:MAG: VWA domain-containing protein [Alphaproteobacteria bacterium]|nr:MAG: VWA domain-containing protein [Alphaproteobacteria bacterium]